MSSGLNDRARRQIALLAGDDLDDEESGDVRRSIELCPECRGYWVRVRGCLDVLDRFGRASEPLASESLWPGIESRLRPAIVVPQKMEQFNGWIPALSMAAACVALLVAGQMDRFGPQDVSPATSDAMLGAALLDGRSEFAPGSAGTAARPWYVVERPLQEEPLVEDVFKKWLQEPPTRIEGGTDFSPGLRFFVPGR